MAEEKKIVAFKVVVDTSDLDRSAAAAVEKVEQLKKEQQSLDKTTDSGRIAYQKYNAEIKQAQAELRRYTDLQRNAIVSNKAQEGSNKQLRAQLSLVTEQYNALSAEQRENSEAGKLLGQQVADLTAKLKANEGAVGDNRRNVGGYKDAILEAGNELKVNSALTDVNRKANLGLQNQMEASARSAAAIAGTFALLSNVIGENEKAQKALRIITLAVAGAQVLSNLAKEKGAILDTIQFAKTKALTVAQGAYNLVIKQGTLAANAFRVALAGLGIGAVIAGIIALVGWQKRQAESANEAAEAQRDLNDVLQERAEMDSKTLVLAEKWAEQDKAAIRVQERKIELRKAEGAGEEELFRLESELNDLRRVATFAVLDALDKKSTRRAEYEQLYNDILFDQQILEAERAKRLRDRAKELQDMEALEVKRVETIEREAEAVKITATNWDAVSEALIKTDPFYEKILQRQKELLDASLLTEQERIAALEDTANVALNLSNEIGQAFADSIEEAGFNVETFFRRLLTLGIDVLQRQLLIAIAEIYFKSLAENGLLGIAKGAALTAIVVAATESAKAAVNKPLKFEQGGEYSPLGVDVGGNLHTSGGTKYYGEDGNVIELERGEKMFIANRKTSQIIKHVAGLNQLMGGKGLAGASSFLEDGGFATRGATDSVNAQFNTAKLATDIVRSLPEFQVSVSEINSVQSGVKTVQTVTSL